MYVLPKIVAGTCLHIRRNLGTGCTVQERQTNACRCLEVCVALRCLPYECFLRILGSLKLRCLYFRHTGNGAVIARCSQPEVGWLGWRSSEDEYLISAIADACAFDRGRTTSVDNLDDFQADVTPPPSTTPNGGDRELMGSKVGVAID